MVSHLKEKGLKKVSEMPVPYTPGETVFITMKYRSSETVQRSGNFQVSVKTRQCNSKMKALISKIKIMML